LILPLLVSVVWAIPGAPIVAAGGRQVPRERLEQRRGDREFSTQHLAQEARIGLGRRDDSGRELLNAGVALTETNLADVVALTDAKLVMIAATALQESSATCRMHFYQSFLEVLANRLALANQRLAAF